MTLRPIYRGWMAFARVLGAINGFILLSLVFYLMFLPLALVFRVRGKDPLHRRVVRGIGIPTGSIVRAPPIATAMSGSSRGKRHPALAVLLCALGLFLLGVMIRRHLTGRIRDAELLSPANVLFPWKAALSTYLALTAPALLSLALGVRGLWRSSRRALAVVIGALFVVVAVPLAEEVLRTHPDLLGRSRDTLPRQGDYLFDERRPDPRWIYCGRFGYRPRPGRDEYDLILTDELIRENRVPGLTRLPEPRPVAFRTDELGFRRPDPPRTSPPWW